MTAAFVMMYNEWAHTYPSKDKFKSLSLSGWKYGKEGRYKTWLVNGVDTGNSQYAPFEYYNGRSPGERFFSAAGNGAVNAVHFVGEHGDGIGLALSVGAMATPGGWGYAMGVAAIGVDIGQGDMYGVGFGTAAILYESKVTGFIDIGYGIIQAFGGE